MMRGLRRVILPISSLDAFGFWPYGHIFYDFRREECSIEKWPQPSWRPVVDGVGGGVTEGEFTLEWKDDKFYASNSGVADGDYVFASKKGERISLLSELNYHACGSQLFFTSQSPLILAVAKTFGDNDNVTPLDWKAFVIPKNVGVSLDAGVWHAPPILFPSNSAKVIVKTRQAKVHSKIYYDPLEEDSTLLEIEV